MEFPKWLATSVAANLNRNSSVVPDSNGGWHRRVELGWCLVFNSLMQKAVFVP